MFILVRTDRTTGKHAYYRKSGVPSGDWLDSRVNADIMPRSIAYPLALELSTTLEDQISVSLVGATW